MSRAMTANQFDKLMKKWGVDFEPWKSSWENHNRNHKGDWGDMHGVMLHHTGPFSSNVQMMELLWDGYPGLPGPLCNVGLATNGHLRGIGWGRANHAGLGDDEVLRHVIAEDYGKVPGDGARKEAKIDGNSQFYGIEVIHSGMHQMDRDQYIVMVLFAAAICDWHGWSEKSVIGHGEWQPGKWDPGYKRGHMMDMAAVRFDIRQALKAGPGNWPKREDESDGKADIPKPEPSTPAENDGLYTVKDDDTLWSIADEFLGDGGRWPEIVGANPKVFPLPIGAKLEIPKK